MIPETLATSNTVNGMDKVSGKKITESPIRFSDDARTLFAHLLLAGKNVFLYPDGHSISEQSLRQFHEKLESFLLQHGEFRIDIEKDRVTCQGENVHVGPFEEGTPLFALFRDGIKWLEFSAGVTGDEVRELLNIMKRYKLLSTEPDGDFVTALWEKRFSHIQYEAADIFFDDQAADVSRYMRQGDRRDAPKRAVLSDEVDDRIDPVQLVLTDREREGLQSMILLEETADESSHLFVLLDSLLLYDDEGSFRIVLDVLAEEFKNFFIGRKFESCLIILEGVRHIMDSGRLGAAWAGRLMDALLMKISDGEHFKTLGEIWQGMQVRQVEILARILQRLYPQAAPHVAPLLLMPKQPHLQGIVEDTLISYVNRDADCFKPLVGSADEKMALRLIPLLARVETEAAMKYLGRLMRHSSAPVRRLAVRTIAQGRKFPAAEIFELIDDPDEAVCRMILRQLSLERDPVAEALLLRYLQHTRFTKARTGHVLECFKTLGKCGSQCAVPYLRETLLGRKWTSSFLQSPFRRGAALALAALKIPESDQVIEEARRSMHPGLRRTIREICGDGPVRPGGGQ